MIADDFIPQKWLNSIFSELENYELTQNPYEEWFLWNTATLKKRDGLYTLKNSDWSYDWETDGTILWKVVYGWLSFFWDDLGKVYRFEKIWWNYQMTKVFNNEDGIWDPIVSIYDVDYNWNEVKQKAKIMSYVTTLKNSWTADKVLSTNDDGNWNVVLVVNELAIFETTDVWKYIYFTNSASNNAKYQIRQIVQFVDESTVYLSEQFYAEPSTRAVDEVGETYDTIDNVVVFNNLRDINGLCLTVSTLSNAEIGYRNLWWIDIEIFEWRWWAISNYWTSVWGSLATWEYEILDPDTILGSSTNGRWQKMNSLILFKNYLMVNIENSIWVIWQIWANSTVTPIYNLNIILNGESSFSVDSLCEKDSGMYFIWKDRIFNSWDINAVSTNIIQGVTKNQWIIINHFLSQIKDSDYVRVYDYGKWIMIQYANSLGTTMLAYDDIYECWLPWIYNWLEIKDKFELFYGDLLIWVGDKICIKQWNIDITENISVKCVVTGSKQIVNSIFSLKKIKLMLWYFWNSVQFKITVNIGKQVFLWTTTKDADGILYLMWQNIAALWGTLGSSPIGFNQLWGVNTVAQSMAKVGLIGIPIGRRCTYYKITLENIDNYDLNICWITALIESWNPYVTPLQNVF